MPRQVGCQRPAAQGGLARRGGGDAGDRLVAELDGQPPGAPRQAVAEGEAHLDRLALDGANAIEADDRRQAAQRQPRPDDAEGDDSQHAAAQNEALRMQEQPAQQRRRGRQQEDAERVVEEAADLGAERREAVVLEGQPHPAVQGSHSFSSPVGDY